MDLELMPGSGFGTQKIHSWIRNKSFRIHNTAYIYLSDRKQFDSGSGQKKLGPGTLESRGRPASIRMGRCCYLFDGQPAVFVVEYDLDGGGEGALPRRAVQKVPALLRTNRAELPGQDELHCTQQLSPFLCNKSQDTLTTVFQK